VQIPKFDAKPKPNLNPNPNPMPIRFGQMTLQTMTLRTSELSPFYFIKRVEFDFVTIVCRPTGSAWWGRSTPVGETRARFKVRRRRPLDRGPGVDCCRPTYT